MPRTTERSELIKSIKTTYEALGVQLAAQILQDERNALIRGEEDSDDGEDEDEDEERDFRRGFYDACFSILDRLDRMLERVEGSRYVAERRCWRGLKQSREGTLEWYFSMDVRWFRSQVGHEKWDTSTYY